jgi:hypothetical protein
MVGYHSGPHAAATWAVARTLHAEFPLVRAYRDRAPDNRPDETANIVFFASNGGLEFDVPASFEFNGVQIPNFMPLERMAKRESAARSW